MLVGTAITGTRDQSADDAGQRAFHAGDNNETRAAAQTFAAIEQSVKTRDADVVKRVHVIAHDLQGNDRFFRHRNVRGAGRHDHHGAFAVNRRIFDN